MTFRKRSAVMGIVVGFFLVFYGTAKYNSHLLVEYVVERTLVQKAPAGTDPDKIRRHLQELLAAASDRHAKTELLFRISRDLEKVQVLSSPALVELMNPERYGILEK